MVLVNCGCGSKFHKDWVNLDFASNYVDVIDYNLLEGLPFQDCYVDFIYNSHFLEHLSRQQAAEFLKECHRVLKEKGTVRIVIPDLENLAREYLRVLEEVTKRPDEIELKKEYEFICLEMLDQMVRQETGGELGKFKKVNASWSYLQNRVGNINIIQRHPKRKENATRIKEKVNAFFQRRSPWADVYSRGKFELSGEKHLWMYDKYSISALLKKCGFTNINFFSFNESKLEGFCKYNLETIPGGKEYKPNSIYVEGQK